MRGWRVVAGQSPASPPPPPSHRRHHHHAQTSELEAELRRRQEDLRRITAAHSEAQQQARAAQEAERAEQQRLQAAKRREWQAGTALTQLTQAPPPELAATQEGEGEDAAQAEVWQVCDCMGWRRPLLAGCALRCAACLAGEP